MSTWRLLNRIIPQDPDSLHLLSSPEGKAVVNAGLINETIFLEIPQEARKNAKSLADLIGFFSIPKNDPENLRTLLHFINLSKTDGIPLNFTLTDFLEIPRERRKIINFLHARKGLDDLGIIKEAGISLKDLSELPSKEWARTLDLLRSPTLDLLRSPIGVEAFKTGLISWQDFSKIKWKERKDTRTILDLHKYFKISLNELQDLGWLITSKELSVPTDKVFSLKDYLNLPPESRKNIRTALNKKIITDVDQIPEKIPNEKQESVFNMLFSTDGMTAMLFSADGEKIPRDEQESVVTESKAKPLITLEKFLTIPEDKLSEAKDILDLHEYFDIPSNDPKHLRSLLFTTQGLAVVRAGLLSLEDFLNIKGESLKDAKSIFDLYHYFKIPKKDPEGLRKIFPDLDPADPDSQNLAFFSNKKGPRKKREIVAALGTGTIDFDTYLNIPKDQREKYVKKRLKAYALQPKTIDLDNDKYVTGECYGKECLLG